VAVMTIGPGVICLSVIPLTNVGPSLHERTSTISWNVSHNSWQTWRRASRHWPRRWKLAREVGVDEQGVHL
jgi:hypothetical protein